MHKFFDFEIAYYLYKISRILAIFEDNKYKSEAYFNAAMAIDAYDTYVFDLLCRNELPKMIGIGSSSEKIIKEIVETGKCSLLLDLEKKYQIEDYSLILISGLNNKLIKKLFEYDIKKFEQLLARRAQLTEIGLSKKEIEQLNIFIENHLQVYGQYLYSYAYCLSNELVEYLNNGQNYFIAQRYLEWSNKVKFAKIVCLNDRKDEIVDLLNKSERYCEVEIYDERIFCRSIFGLPFELMLVDQLLPQGDSLALRGDLHMHTTWSDGVHNISQMVARAKELGREYIGITDHSFSLRVANGLSEVDAVQQIEEIHRLRDMGIKIFAGIEVEVLKDGSLDFSDSILSQFDYVIAGIHTFLNQKHNELKQRIETALKNPYVNIFAHPSSRILGRPGVLFSERDSFSVGMDEIIDICSQNDVAIEFNCFPERFDVDVQYFNKIINHGLAISVGSDSHSAAHLNCIKYAEEALINFPEIESNILNFMSFEQIRAYFNHQRTMKTDKAFIEINKDVKNFNYFF